MAIGTMDDFNKMKSGLETQKNEAEVMMDGAEVGRLEEEIAKLEATRHEYESVVEKAGEVPEAQLKQVEDLGGNKSVLDNKLAENKEQVVRVEKNLDDQMLELHKERDAIRKEYGAKDPTMGNHEERDEKIRNVEGRMTGVAEEMKVKGITERFNFLDTLETGGDEQEKAIEIIVKMQDIFENKELVAKLPMAKLNEIVQRGLGKFLEEGNVDTYESWSKKAKERGFEIVEENKDSLESFTEPFGEWPHTIEISSEGDYYKAAERLKKLGYRWNGDKDLARGWDNSFIKPPFKLVVEENRDKSLGGSSGKVVFLVPKGTTKDY